jgi:cytochrome c
MSRFAAAALVACGLLPAAAAAAGNPAAGAQLFKLQCGACHSTDAGTNRVGPSLFGVVGRKSGSVEGFRYSAANRNAGITWTAEALDKYLANPRAVVPGTIMPYAGLNNAAQRADLIAYLATLK